MAVNTDKVPSYANNPVQPGQDPTQTPYSGVEATEALNQGKFWQAAIDNSEPPKPPEQKPPPKPQSVPVETLTQSSAEGLSGKVKEAMDKAVETAQKSAPAPGRFNIPDGAKAIAFDWKATDSHDYITRYTSLDASRPTTYELNGEKYYTPYSVEYQRGFKTEKERFKVDSDSSKAPYVAIRNDSGELMHVTRAEAEALGKLDGENLFDQLQTMGVVSKDAEYLGKDKQGNIMARSKAETAAIQDFYKNNIEVEVQGQNVYIPRNVYDALSLNERKELKKTGKISAAPVNTQPAATETTYQKKNDKGAWVDIGADEYYTLQERASANAENTRTQQKALDSLAGYKSGDSYDLAAYLRDNKDERNLVTAGFTYQDIADAKDYNRVTRGIGAPDYKSLQQYQKDYFKDKGWQYTEPRQLDPRYYDRNAQKEWLAHIAEATQAHDEQYRPEVPKDEFIDNYFSDRGWQRITKPGAASRDQLQTYDNRLLAATSAYDAKYGSLATLESGSAKIASLVFMPARAIAPETQVKDLKATDYIIGGAQLALVTAPAFGKLAGDLIQKGATAAITAETLRNWDNMSSSERKVALAIDTALLIATYGKDVAGLIKRSTADRMASYDGFLKDIRGNSEPRPVKVKGLDWDAIEREIKQLKTGERQAIEAMNAKEIAEAKLKSLNRGQTVKDIETAIDESIDANKGFINNAERTLKDNPGLKQTTREKIQEALKEARKQVAVAEKLKTPLQDFQEFPAGKYPLAKTEEKPGVPAKTTAKTPAPVPKTPLATPAKTPARTTTKQPSRLPSRETEIMADTRILVQPAVIPLRKGSTKTKALPLIYVSPDTRVAPYPVPQTKPQPAIETQTETRTQTKTETKTETKPKPEEKTETKPAPYPVTKTQPKPKPASKPKTPTPTNTETRTFKGNIPGSGKDDKATRKAIKDAGGAITWRQGSIGGKDRWDTIVKPFASNADYKMVLGAPPQGATIVQRGKGSAYGTAQVVRGKGPTRAVRVDSGFTDITLSPTGRKKIAMRVTGDPGNRTKGDITIGESKPKPISEVPKLSISERRALLSQRAPRISGRGFRISPRMPRLR